ncbi:bacillithiol biosynthesis deacetylase BshB2 [Metasolibacillus sp.]|uniref:bacillithiol biosynthesis deacetylase BshB2 n=1 Tax=Metasolibacillus sp. TaxID=2703680 RepID=UPI0025D79B0D|nr:bacillithiol biosynthesis deacetylase BshB2 [Metasolibacillus sp.]MCT6923499.1 bacillithiol biosynthesis deacetylase BshB2 [Metasolibacillus sp.]MCT6939779.1 bacillithiol biosynthesis deacetylase BshB2 [Metasolibacillus sp.]
MTLPSERHVLIIFPHPDDEAFSVAGIARLYHQMGVPVTYACLTLGEMGRNLGNPPFATRESLPEIRRKELIAACEAMAIPDLRMMGLRDKTIEFEDDEKMVQLVTALIEELNPSVIYSFYPHYAVHPDHEATARAVKEAVRRIDKDTRPRLLGCAFANNTLAELGEPHVVVDIKSVGHHKLRALQAHASQTGWMMAETAKRVDDGETPADSWLSIEKFYVVQQDDELGEPIQRVHY